MADEAKTVQINEKVPLRLLEAPGGDGVFNEDGTVNVVLIRPCDGRGPGKRIYRREMLQEHASQFAGWPSYLNHDDPRARRTSAKLRRGPEELAGEIRETFWDDTFTTDEDPKRGYEPGGVMAKFMPASDFVEGLIRRIPGQMSLSIKAHGNGRPGKRKDGTTGFLVESIDDDQETSSFDLVTARGAGGRVVSLLESTYDPGMASGTDGLATALEGIEDGELREWLAENRPTVLPTPPSGGENEMGKVTLQEALQSPEVQGWLQETVQQQVAVALADAETEREQQLETERAELRESIRAELAEPNRWRSLGSYARELIESARLPGSSKAALLEDYGLTDEADDKVRPGRLLALCEAVTDQDGQVTKTAREVLKDSIEGDVKRHRGVLAEARPTLPLSPGGGSGTTTTGARFGGAGSSWAAMARSEGLDPKKFGATPEPAATT